MLDFIKSRRSTRSFTDVMPEKALIESIVEAGRYAPSGGNNQTTHFMVITDPEVLEKLVPMVEKAFAVMEETPDMYKSMLHAVKASKRGGYVFHYHTPCLIITANKKIYGNNIADCSCALENMMLMANALDLGSVWINQLKWLNEDPELLAYERSLGLKEDERIYGALAVGYPKTEDGLPNRNPLPRTGNEVTWI